MPAVSDKQRKFFSVVYAARKGKIKPSNLSGAAKDLYKSDMPTIQMKDFMKVKEAELPFNLTNDDKFKIRKSLKDKFIVSDSEIQSIADELNIPKYLITNYINYLKKRYNITHIRFTKEHIEDIAKKNYLNIINFDIHQILLGLSTEIKDTSNIEDSLIIDNLKKVLDNLKNDPEFYLKINNKFKNYKKESIMEKIDFPQTFTNLMSLNEFASALQNIDNVLENRFSIGSRVKIKETGELGEINAWSDIDQEYTVIIDNKGIAKQFPEESLSILESTNEETDLDDNKDLHPEDNSDNSDDEDDKAIKLQIEQELEELKKNPKSKEDLDEDLDELINKYNLDLDEDLDTLLNKIDEYENDDEDDDHKYRFNRNDKSGHKYRF